MSERVAPLPRPAASGAVSRRSLLTALAASVVGGEGAGPASAAVAGGAPSLSAVASEAAPRPAGSAASARSRTVVRQPAAPAFRSRPDLLPPKVEATTGPAASGNILITPIATPTARGSGASFQVAEGLGQPGAMMIGPTGELIWFSPTSGMATNLQVQTLRGQPVLTYWEGTPGNGIGFGKGYVLDARYALVATVAAGNGATADLHDLTLTPQDSALVTAYVPRRADLSAIGGSADGTVYDSVVQEIDLRTGKVLLDWRSLDHVPVTETNAGLTAPPFDYFHVNSASTYDDDELLISARNTWTLYRVDRRSGAVIARINGRHSDYRMGPGTDFYWQHHSRQRAAGQVSVFDDGSSPPHETRSRGLLLAVDDVHKTVQLVKQFVHPANLLAEFEGSMQPLTGGGAFVGWGDEPYFSEFASDGSLVFDGRLPINGQTYRAFLANWVGTPVTLPDVALASDAMGGRVVYASWNGATQVASWQVLSGSTPSRLSAVATVPRAGFETAITVRPSGKLIAVVALDAKGQRLATSATLSA